MTNRARARATIAALLAAAALPLVPAAAQEARPRAPAAVADAAREPLAERARDYAEARRPFFEARLPEALRQPGPRGLLWWQWLALPTLLVIALVAGALLGWLSRVILAHVVTRTRTLWDDRLLARVTRPL